MNIERVFTKEPICTCGAKPMEEGYLIAKYNYWVGDSNIEEVKHDNGSKTITVTHVKKFIGYHYYCSYCGTHHPRVDY